MSTMSASLPAPFRRRRGPPRCLPPAIDPAHGTDDIDGRFDDDVVPSAQSSLTRSRGIGLAHMDPLIERGAELTSLTRSLE
jgi:hypothetical protein